MFLIVAQFLGLVLSAWIVVYIISIISKQWKTNQFLRKASPNLPVPYELMSIFGGHIRTIVLTNKNISLIDKLHRQYGKTFGAYYCDKVFVCTTDTELIKAIVADEPYRNLDKFDCGVPIDELTVDNIGTAEHIQWRRLRKAFAPSLAHHKIKSSPSVLSDVENSINQLKQVINRKLDAEGAKVAAKPDVGVFLDTSTLFSRYILSIIFKSFYKQEKLIDFYSKSDYYSSLMEKAARGLLNPFFAWAVIFPPLMKLIQWTIMRFHPQGTLRRSILNFSRRQIELNFKARQQLLIARKQAEDANLAFDEDNFTLEDGSSFKRNLIDSVIENFYEKKIKERELLHSTSFLFFAAVETTSDAITILFHNLACNQEVQNRLRESILREGEESEFLGWCISESLRLFPPVPFGCSRTIAKDYFTKEGILIPKGSFVNTSTYTIHRSTEYWGEDANEFKPDRWSKSKDFHPTQYLTFGYGVRNCIGKHFALYLMRKLVASLLRDYKFSKCPKTPENLKFCGPLFMILLFEEKFHVEVSRINCSHN